MEETTANSVRVILGSLLRIGENFMGGLYCLELGIEFEFFAWIPIGMIFKSFGKEKLRQLRTSDALA